MGHYEEADPSTRSTGVRVENDLIVSGLLHCALCASCTPASAHSGNIRGEQNRSSSLNWNQTSFPLPVQIHNGGGQCGNPSTFDILMIAGHTVLTQAASE